MDRLSSAREQVQAIQRKSAISAPHDVEDDLQRVSKVVRQFPFIGELETDVAEETENLARMSIDRLRIKRMKA